MARNLLIITIVGGINIHSPAILGYHPGTTEFHRKKKRPRHSSSRPPLWQAWRPTSDPWGPLGSSQKWWTYGGRYPLVI